MLINIMEEFILQMTLQLKMRLDDFLSRLKILNFAKIQCVKQESLISKIHSSIVNNPNNSFVKTVLLLHGFMKIGIVQKWKDLCADLILSLLALRNMKTIFKLLVMLEISKIFTNNSKNVMELISKLLFDTLPKFNISNFSTS